MASGDAPRGGPADEEDCPAAAAEEEELAEPDEEEEGAELPVAKQEEQILYIIYSVKCI